MDPILLRAAYDATLLRAARDAGCLTSGGRTAKELYVKLIVINFTVLYSYAHLLRDRKERWVIVRVIVCCLWPFAAVWHVLLPLVAIPSQALLHLGMWNRIEEAIGITLGPFGGDGMTAPPARMKEWLRRASGPTHSIPTQYVRSSIGNAVTGFVLLAQSITSLWLIQRRAAAGALFDVDIRVLQLAVAGLCTGTMLITLSMPVPVYPRNSKCWLLLVRQREQPANPLIVQFLTGAWLLPQLCSWSGRRVVILDFVKDIVWSQSSSFKQNILISIGLFSIIVVGIVQYDSGRAVQPIHLILAPLEFTVTFILVLLCVIVSTWVATTGLLEYVILFQGGIARGDTPNYWITTPCRLTWSDPAAEWVWWLA